MLNRSYRIKLTLLFCALIAVISGCGILGDSREQPTDTAALPRQVKVFFATDRAPDAEGRAYYGEFVEVDVAGPTKNVELELARAYPVAQLTGARRHLMLNETGVVWLQDTFSFSDNPLPVEEAFITWLDVEARGATTIIRSQNHQLQLTIESPEGLQFEVESLTEQCQANAKPGVLKRITVTLPVTTDPQFRVRLEIVGK